MNETTPPRGRAVSDDRPGGRRPSRRWVSLSADAGGPGLREEERRLEMAGRPAACIDDPRDPHPAQLRRRPARPDDDDRGAEGGRRRRRRPARRPRVQRRAGAVAVGARPLLAVHRQRAREPARPVQAAAHGPRDGRAPPPRRRDGAPARRPRPRRHLRRRAWRPAVAPVRGPSRRRRLSADRRVRRRRARRDGEPSPTGRRPAVGAALQTGAAGRDAGRRAGPAHPRVAGRQPLSLAAPSGWSGGDLGARSV